MGSALVLCRFKCLLNGIQRKSVRDKRIRDQGPFFKQVHRHGKLRLILPHCIAENEDDVDFLEMRLGHVEGCVLPHPDHPQPAVITHHQTIAEQPIPDIPGIGIQPLVRQIEFDQVQAKRIGVGRRTGISIALQSNWLISY